MERNPILKLKGHQNSVECVTFLDSERLGSGDHEGMFYIWDLEKGVNTRKMLVHKEVGIWACESQFTFLNRKRNPSSNKNLVALGSSDQLISMVDSRSGRLP